MIVLKGQKIIPEGIKAVFLGRRRIFGKDGGEPVLKKLSAPVIRLETEEEAFPEERTPAILGIAVLGKTILGLTSVLPKLSAPVIRIEDAEEVLKLETPVIRLETVSDDEPVVPQKLGAPVIRLETIEGGEEPEIPDVPAITKLNAPVIRLETIEEPEIPVITKLDAPVIVLEVIEDEPDIPEEPEIQEKLSAPVIEIAEEEETPEKPEEPLTAILDGDTLHFNGGKEGVNYVLVSPNEEADSGFGMETEIDGVVYFLIAFTLGENHFILPEVMSAIVPGEYTLYVLGEDKLSNAVTYRHGKLPKPEIFITNNKLNAPSYVIITSSNNRITWDRVEGAEYYGISYKKADATGSNPWTFVDGVEHPTNYYDLSELFTELEPGEYIFAVYATNVTEDATGDWAETTYIKE